MASTLTLEKAFKDRRLPKLLKINFQIEQHINKSKLKIRDGSTGNFHLEILDSKFNGSKYLEIGKFVKVINPSLRKEDFTVLVDRKSIVCLGEAINSLEILFPFQTLAFTLELEGNTEIPGKILAKVVRIFDPRGPIPSQFGGMRMKYVFEVKDVHDTKQTISIWKPWKPNTCPVETGKCYIFSNVKTDKFMKKPYWLVGDINGIKDATKEQEEALKNITFHDGNFYGKILAINDVKLYKSCNKCNRSIENFTLGSPCPKCQKKLEAVINDFSFTMNIDSGDDIIFLTGFKKTISFEGPCTDENVIEDLINSQFEGKTAEGDFLKYGNFEIPAINKVTFS